MAAYILALLLESGAWIWVSRLISGRLGDLAIAILAVIIFFVLSIILGAVFGLLIPAHQLFPTFQTFMTNTESIAQMALQRI